MSRGSVFVLVHSPLTGAGVWSSVATELRREGRAVLAPSLGDSGGLRPYWQDHSESVATELAELDPVQPVILVGHSGAGPLLPAMGRSGGPRVSGYVFVDAGLPAPGHCRLDGLPEELCRHLERGGRFPEWTDADLATILPDPARRRQLIAELQPRGMDYFGEELPIVPDWPDAPCAYLLLSRHYEPALAEARRLCWPCKELRAGHFHMLVDPPAVANAIACLAARIEA